MSDFLERVVAERRADAASLDWNLLAAAARDAEPARGFAAALRRARAAGHRAVIAEVKRVSPALGTLAAAADPVALAAAYVAGGAAAISVLTEPRHWGGSLDDLRAVRAAVAVPVLCKDVVVDPKQVVAARAAGADAVLLIAEALGDEELAELIGLAATLGMDALVEAHEPDAFSRVLASPAVVVGVNARDLRHPATLLPDRIAGLAPQVGTGRVLVAESGIRTAADAARLPARVDAMLVGTALMTAADPGAVVRALATSPLEVRA